MSSAVQSAVGLALSDIINSPNMIFASAARAAVEAVDPKGNRIMSRTVGAVRLRPMLHACRRYRVMGHQEPVSRATVRSMISCRAEISSGPKRLIPRIGWLQILPVLFWCSSGGQDLGVVDRSVSLFARVDADPGWRPRLATERLQSSMIWQR